MLCSYATILWHEMPIGYCLFICVSSLCHVIGVFFLKYEFYSCEYCFFVVPL